MAEASVRCCLIVPTVPEGSGDYLAIVITVDAIDELDALLAR